MERRRTRLRVLLEEEEEDMDRRSSQRFRKRVRYIEDDEEKEEEQPGPSTQNTFNQRTQENRLLSVTCGNKKGTLDVEKLGRGEGCIECEGHWFAPPAFEDFAGKGHFKKWKISIFHENKPLQFWFEQGSLTTKGYKRSGSETAKYKKILSSDCESESASEEPEIDLQSAEETEEDDVKDEDRPPGSEEFASETGGGRKGSETKLFISASKKSALQRKLQVLIKRLPEYWKNEEERGHNALAKDDNSVTSATHINPTQIADPPIIGGIKEENGEELSDSDTKSNDSEEDGQREIKIEAVNSTSLANSSPDIKPDILNKTEDGGSTSNHTINLSASFLLVTVTDTGVIGNMIGHTDNLQGTEDGELETRHCGEKEEEWRRAMRPEMPRQFIEHFKDCDSANNEHLYMPKSEASGQAFANENVDDANTSPIQRGFKEENVGAMSIGSPTIPTIVLVESRSENSGHTDVATSGHNAAQLQEMEQEKRCPQTVQASDVVEDPSAGFNLDTMDLDQLKREKIKMQLKVLKLQEEYYTLQIKKFKQ